MGGGRVNNPETKYLKELMKLLRIILCSFFKKRNLKIQFKQKKYHTYI